LPGLGRPKFLLDLAQSASCFVRPQIFPAREQPDEFRILWQRDWEGHERHLHFFLSRGGVGIDLHFAAQRAIRQRNLHGHGAAVLIGGEGDVAFAEFSSELRL
jgi:hypothetical protein